MARAFDFTYGGLDRAALLAELARADVHTNEHADWLLARPEFTNPPLRRATIAFVSAGELRPAGLTSFQRLMRAARCRVSPARARLRPVASPRPSRSARRRRRRPQRRACTEWCRHRGVETRERRRRSAEGLLPPPRRGHAVAAWAPLHRGVPLSSRDGVRPGHEVSRERVIERGRTGPCNPAIGLAITRTMGA